MASGTHTLTEFCLHCGVEFERQGGKVYCSEECRRQATARKPREYQQHKGDTCERCGFVAEDPCQLDVHHRDRNRNNNDPANLETVCANCHRLEHKVKALA